MTDGIDGVYSSVPNAMDSIGDSVLSFQLQSLSVHRLAPTHEAAETVLQLLALTLCHVQKDDLVVVASKFLDAWQNCLKTLTAGIAFPMLATLLQPELLQGSNDLFLNFLTSTGMIAYDDLLSDEEYPWNGWLLAIPG